MKHGDNFECILCGVEVKGKIIIYKNERVTYTFLAQDKISIRNFLMIRLIYKNLSMYML